MNLLDRLRDRFSASTADAAWDDGDAADVAATVATMAATWDASSDDPRVSASRSVVLGRYAAETPERVSPLPGTPGRLPPTTGVVPLIRRGGRRPVLVLVAAGLLLAMSIGTVMASVPGGPLYGLRVASEAFLLPPEPEAWATAQVERLDRRVAEAADAAERDDRGALAAALRSYARIATETAAGASLDPATAARLLTRVQVQLEMISRIAADDAALATVRTEAQVAARSLLAVLGGPGGPAGPNPGEPGGATPSATSPTATPGSRESAPAGPSGGAGSPGGPGPTPSPGGPGPTVTPGGPGGPTSTPGGPGPTSTPGGAGPGPTSTPGGPGGPTATPGGGGSGPTATPGGGGPGSSGGPGPTATPGGADPGSTGGPGDASAPPADDPGHGGQGSTAAPAPGSD